MGLVIQSVGPNHFSKELLKYIFMELDFMNLYYYKYFMKGLHVNKVLGYNLLIRPRVQLYSYSGIEYN